MTTIRIVCTNDFLSSLAPHATDTGTLPGGHALQDAVRRLSQDGPTIWADAGDFSQGAPLSTRGEARETFTAASALGIDVATVGNHEFDWGLERLTQEIPRLSFPVVCANVDIGVPPATLIDSEAGPVGFIGLTHPQLAAFTPNVPEPEPDLTSIVPPQAARLRAEGAVAVVILIHFGVNWTVDPDGTHRPDPTPVLELLQPVTGHVDAVVLGHTLGRWTDTVDGVPYVQPWAFGAELGVIDLDLTDGEHTCRLEPVDDPRRPWTGPGATTINQSEADVVGSIDRPLTINFATDISLATFAARALLDAAGADGAVVPVVGMHQPAIGGVMYHWPAGEVTDAQIGRLWPWTDDTCLVTECSPQTLQSVLEFVAPEPWLAWGTAGSPTPAAERCRLIVPVDYVDWATVQIAALTDEVLEWTPSPVQLRDALRRAVASSKPHAQVET